MSGQMITFSDGAEKFDAYLAPSATGKGPGVILLQEWWGLVGHIKEIADRLALAGFTALAPDLFRGKTAEEPDDAQTLMMALHIGETEKILRKAILTLLTRPETDGQQVGVIGFCMGGQLALFAAGSNPVICATVDFYGIHPNVIPTYRSINGPILGIFGEDDHMVSPALVDSLDEELTLMGKKHEFVTYPGLGHAFFNPKNATYNADAAEDAWNRTIAFLNANLKSVA